METGIDIDEVDLSTIYKNGDGDYLQGEWAKHTLSLGVHNIIRAQKGRLSQKREKQFVIFP